MEKGFANNSTISASISYIFAMCLALCFTNILFKFLDRPMGSESLSPLYKYRTESQRGKWLAQCHTSCQMEEPGFKLMCIWHQALFGISHCLHGLPQRLFPRGKETVCQMQEMWVWPLGWDDPLEKEMQPTPWVVFLTGNPKDRGAWWALVHGVAKQLDKAITTLPPYWRFTTFLGFFSNVENIFPGSRRCGTGH